MTWLDWAVLVLVLEVIIILIPLTLTVVALLRSNLPTDPPDPLPPPTEPGIYDQSVLMRLSDYSDNLPYPGDVIDSKRLTINTPNAVYENWRFDREVDVKAAGVTFLNCYFEGLQTGGYNTALVRSISGGSFVATYCTIKPAHPNDGPDGVRGSGFTLKYCDISGTVDGIHIYGDLDDFNDPKAGNVHVENCWLHDFVWYNNGSHSDGTHNDCVQIVGGSHITFRRTRFSGTSYNAVFMIQQNENVVRDVVIEECLFESDGKTASGAGQYTVSGVNLYDAKGPDPIRDLVIRNNHFVRGAQKYPLLISGRTLDSGAQVTGNVFEDGGEVPVIRGS